MKLFISLTFLLLIGVIFSYPTEEESNGDQQFDEVGDEQFDVEIPVADDDERILYGIKQTQSYPFLASLKIFTKSSSEVCGGSLIAPQWVLTAAHCLHLKNPKVIAHFNSIDLFKGVKVNALTKTFKHPQYKYGSYVENDIALLKLERKLGANEAQPIDLPDKSQTQATKYGGTSGLILGWGRTELGTITSTLRGANLTIINNDKCNKELLTNSQMCINTGTDPKTVSQCVGDSGGPMILSKTAYSKPELIGIISYTAPSLKDECNHYAILTKVAAYRDWILKTIKDN